MSLQEWNTLLQPAVDAEMRSAVDSHLLGNHDELRSVLAYHLNWEGPGAGLDGQGKRIRPLLLLLTTAACSKDWQAALPAAAAVELLHNFSLIHDDIEDQSLLRRGRQTVWAIWGVPLAINAGDALFSLANRSILRLEQTAGQETALKAACIYLDACIELTGGQHRDIASEQLPALSLLEYDRLISGKTAALLAASTHLGALIAGVLPERQEAFRRFGHALGLAFQAQDDWLEVWGSETETGKSAASDLLSGKKSLPVVYALEQQGEFARRWQARPVLEADIAELRKLLEDDGAEEFTRLQAQKWISDARYSLTQALEGNQSSASAALWALLDLLLKRRS